MSGRSSLKPVEHRLCPSLRRQSIRESVGHQLCPGTWQLPVRSRIRPGQHFECKPVSHRLCPGTRRRCPWSLGPFSLAPPSASGLVPGQTHEAGENPPRFPRFRRQPGQHRSLPHYPSHAPGSSSGFCSSNFWSTATTFFGSPPLSRKNILGHVHQIVAVTGADITCINMKHSVQPMASLYSHTRGLFPEHHTIYHCMYT